MRRHRAAFFPVDGSRGSRFFSHLPRPGRVGDGALAASSSRGVSPLPDPPPRAREGSCAAPERQYQGDRFASSVTAAVLLAFALTPARPAHAQSVESFYRGRTVT